VINNSTKPYLIRAIYEWCIDNQYTPHLAVFVDESTQVPREFVKNDEIVLNVSTVATHHLLIGNDVIEFQARFGGRARELLIPIENVMAVYARETGNGMAFDVNRSPRSTQEMVPANLGMPEMIERADEEKPQSSAPIANLRSTAPAGPILSSVKSKPGSAVSTVDGSGRDDDPTPSKPSGGARGKPRLTRVK
jgi:stringent starvation protein B